MANDLLNIINWHTISTSTKIEILRKIFSITDEKIKNKIAFAFFLDHFTPRSEEEHQKIDALQLEFMGGSLTAKKVISLFEQFLQIEGIEKNYSPIQIELLNEYHALLKESQDQGEVIDLIRSSDVRLLFHASSGSSFWSVGQSAFIKKSEIIGAQEELLKQIKGLQVGEKRLFLLGSLIHETRLLIELKEGSFFELTYFDTGLDNTTGVYHLSQEIIFKDSFWEPLIEAKFGFRNEESDKVCEWIQGYIHAASSYSYHHKRPWAISAQNRQTCHLKSLMAPLKLQIILANQESPTKGHCDWHNFKLGFGEFLLSELKTDNENASMALKALSKKSQILRIKKQALRLEIAKTIETEAKFQEAVDHFRTLFSLFHLESASLNDYKISPYLYTPENILTDLLNELQETLIKCKITEEEFSPEFKNIDHPLIEKLIPVFSDLVERRRSDLVSGKLIHKLKMLLSRTTALPWLQELEKPEQKIPFPPLSEIELEAILDLLCENKEKMANLEPKFLSSLLARALRSGHFKKALELIHSLALIKKPIQSLHNIEIYIPLLRNNFYKQEFNLSILDQYLPISNQLRPSIEAILFFALCLDRNKERAYAKILILAKTNPKISHFSYVARGIQTMSINKTDIDSCLYFIQQLESLKTAFANHIADLFLSKVYLLEKASHTPSFERWPSFQTKELKSRFVLIKNSDEWFNKYRNGQFLKIESDFKLLETLLERSLKRSKPFLVHNEKSVFEGIHFLGNLLKEQETINPFLLSLVLYDLLSFVSKVENGPWNLFMKDLLKQLEQKFDPIHLTALLLKRSLKKELPILLHKFKKDPELKAYIKKILRISKNATH